MGTPFGTARRNFATDVDPATGRIYLVGGYAPSSATQSMEIYVPAQVCITPTPTITVVPSWELYLPAAFYNASNP
jgi:hypothetical protein